MQAKNWIVILIFLLSFSLKGQGEVDVKIDLFPLVIGQGMQFSVEKKVSKKMGIDLSAFSFRMKQSVFSRDSITGAFIFDEYKSKWFASTLSTNIYLFSGKEREMDFYFAPTARMTWATYVDPEYYDASEAANGRRPSDIKDNNPRLDVGFAIGFKAGIFDNIIVEPSLASIFALSDFVRARKEGFGTIGFDGWLSVRLAYRFRKKDKTQKRNN